jgi:3-methyl-2-oxobutanoate hydroxymethyltransferase
MVPAGVAREVTSTLHVPTIGIGAGPHCDAQVLVWQDFAGLRTGPMPRFVKQYANLASVLDEAAKSFAREVADGAFPSEDHSFD